MVRRFRLRSLSYGGQVAPRNDGVELSRDLRQRRVECGGSARQILERANLPRLLRVLFRDTRPYFGEGFAALDHFGRRADMKFMVPDRCPLQQPYAQCDDVVAAAIRDIAIDCDRSVSLMAAELGVAFCVEQLVRSKSLHIGRTRFRA